MFRATKPLHRLASQRRFPNEQDQVAHRVVREHLQTFPQSTYRWVSRGSTMDVHGAPIPLFSPKVSDKKCRSRCCMSWRRAMELAGLVLTLGTKPRAADGSPQAEELKP